MNPQKAQEITDEKKLAKNLLCMMLGEERGTKRFATLEPLIDNIDISNKSAASSAVLTIGRALLDMSDEEFEKISALNTLGEQMQFLLQTNSN